MRLKVLINFRYISCYKQFFLFRSVFESIPPQSCQNMVKGLNRIAEPAVAQLGQYPIPVLMINSHSDRIHSSLSAVHCFDSGYVGNQPVT